MSQPQQSREERLAAKLRENLRRRKAQARALDESSGGALPDAASGTENESAGLSKPASES